MRALEAPSRASILSFSTALAGSVLEIPLLCPSQGRGSSQSKEVSPHRRGGLSRCFHRVTVSQTVVLQAGFVVEPEALVVLLGLGSGLAGPSVVSRPPEEDYGEALSPASGDLGLVSEFLGRGPQSPFLKGFPVLSLLQPP